MSKRVAYGGILLALNIIILSMINIIPMNTLFLMGLASLPISVVIMEYGLKSGIAFYVACILLSFIIISNKIQWIVYISTFGIYGLIKYIIEQDINIYFEYILKILFANVQIVMLYFILRYFIYIPINLLSVLLFQIAFIFYDYAYTLFIGYYNTKIKSKLNKN